MDYFKLVKREANTSLLAVINLNKCTNTINFSGTQSNGRRHQSLSLLFSCTLQPRHPCHLPIIHVHLTQSPIRVTPSPSSALANPPLTSKKHDSRPAGKACRHPLFGCWGKIWFHVSLLCRYRRRTRLFAFHSYEPGITYYSIT